MIGLLQRVRQASVSVDSQLVAAIERGILVFIGIEKTDTTTQAERLVDRLLTYRVFPDAQNKMNSNVVEIAGGVLLVPQFTLVADTRSGTRPSFSAGAAPQLGKQLFDQCLVLAQQRYSKVASGRFGADMQVALINDGPVTFWLQVK
ncbi:MAG: D-tyrosyl-tRNA(Tyr) deacylase [Gammaproteobacteria bacterium]|nr:D-tyrosyl-tRNA(Tyr) deacylase [Gammaproteobacteria bacterium]